jgi:uncharacterized membrane protein
MTTMLSLILAFMLSKRDKVMFCQFDNNKNKGGQEKCYNMCPFLITYKDNQRTFLNDY